MLAGTTDRSLRSAHRPTRFSSDRKSHDLPACRHLVTYCLAERITAQGFRQLILLTGARGRHRCGLPHGIHWRLIQMDYLLTQFGGGSQNDVRFSTGILIKF
jgi:hypothetical protein